ncbi:MAG: hypothetical protein WBF15_20015 [Candidatus Sulfotelmatobacter sp.]
MNNTSVEVAKLTVRHILSVRCPMCRAKPKEPCTLSTGHPSAKTHLARGLAAAKVPPPANFGQAALLFLKSITGRGYRALFHQK